MCDPIDLLGLAIGALATAAGFGLISWFFISQTRYLMRLRRFAAYTIKGKRCCDLNDRAGAAFWVKEVNKLAKQLKLEA